MFEHTMTAPVAPRPPLFFPQPDGSRVPYRVFSAQEVYDREQERIYRGPTWNFLGLECEIPNVGDFKSTFVGDTPVVVTRTDDGFSCWVNRCAHRGAIVCRVKRGNAASHTCVYHQWSYAANGDLQGVPFKRGQKGQAGMPTDFRNEEHGLRKLRVDSYRGLLFATFDETTPPLPEYLGAEMRPWIDRLFHKPIVYLGCTRQYSKSNWKLYLENVKDPYHASLLHLFHTTFNIFRVGMKARSIPDATHGLHSIITATKQEEAAADASTAAAYSAQNIRSMDDGFTLEDPALLGQIREFDEFTTNHIQPIFPQLVIQQIHNTLVARQLLPKGPSNFELVFHFFGYADDTPEMRGTFRDGDAFSTLDMARDVPEQQETLITENLIRRFWLGYQKLMGY
jgi:anthranilate 1,2-dioxygenase large subunit